MTKTFKDRVAADHLSLTIGQGEFFALVDENGAGKTTTIKLLSCLVKPMNGDAIMLGDSIAENPQAVKNVLNISPQETTVARNLSVKENLEFIARIYGDDKKEVQQKADRLMDKFALADRATSKGRTLSGGLERRLRIVMAMFAVFVNITTWLSGNWFELDMISGTFPKVAYLLPYAHAVGDCLYSSYIRDCGMGIQEQDARLAFNTKDKGGWADGLYRRTAGSGRSPAVDICRGSGRHCG